MKRTLFGLLIGVALVLVLGGITATSLIPSEAGWIVNGYTTNASSCEELKAAPGSGYSLYIRQIGINCGTNNIITIGRGESSNDVAAPIIGPVTFKVAGTHYMDWTFLVPIRVQDNNSITVDANNSGAVQVFIAGYTK